MKKKTIQDIEVNGKTIFLRIDFNVPLKNGQITDDTRIHASLPTVKHLLERGAKVVAASHLGRPKGEVKAEFSLKPVVARFSQLLSQEVKFCGHTIGNEVETIKQELNNGEILFLENLRFHPEETKNESAFAQQLARGIDVYINDAFGASHRHHASIEQICQFVPTAAAGFLLTKEIENLNMALDNTPANYLVILGGVKVSDKIPVIKNLMNKASTILIGGAMAYTFLKSTGMQVGKSIIEEDYLPLCREMLTEAGGKGVKVLLPLDHVAATKIEPNITIKMTKQGESIPPEMMGLDIGYDTIKLYCREIGRAELIVWNGPMGVFEIDTFSAGTIEIAKAIAASSAQSIIGGGDSISAVNKAGLASQISHISTGGGASLEFLAGKTLPGIAALSEDK